MTPPTVPRPPPEPARPETAGVAPERTPAPAPVVQAPPPEPVAAPAATVAAAPASVAAPALPAAGPNPRAAIDDGIDWATCGQPSAQPRRSQPAIGTDYRDLPVELEADAAEGFAGEQVAVLQGDVQARWGEDALLAGAVRYDQRQDLIDASGGVLYLRPDLRVAGETAHVDLGVDKGEVTQAEYRILGVNARGSADVARFEGEALSSYEKITYTTCRPGNEDWVLSAGTLKVDRNEGVAEATDATVRVKGVPVAYLPYFSFPVDDRRRSGLLLPSVGSSNLRGLDVSVPYYFNLAPNYDATVTPRILTKRGAMLGGEFRYLTEDSEGTIRGEILPDDRERPDEGTRGAFSVRHTTRVGPWVGAVDYNYVSDPYYLGDLSESFAIRTARYLRRRGDLRYETDDWLGRVRLLDYQTTDPSLTSAQKPYSMLPQLLALGEERDLLGTPLSGQLRAEYVSFYRDFGVTGQRVDLYPALALPLSRSWGYVTPKVGARYTTYALGDPAPGEPNKVDRTLPIASVDGGLFFDRELDWFGTAATQTLEPRVTYLYIPYRNQNDIPVFDTYEFDLSYDSLFLENRFTGADRVNDANQVTVGVTTRLLSEASGHEVLRASVASQFYFEDRRVQLPGEPVADTSTSSLVGELGVQITDEWNARVTGQWDPQQGSSTNQPEKSLARVTYRGAEGRFFRAGYGYTEDVSDYTDVAFVWPVADGLSLIGRWNYSLADDSTVEAVAGIEYGSCCWRIRAVARDYLTGTTPERDTSRVRFRQHHPVTEV
ncbi:MAG: LPS-assembly protein LptD [Gammaproteobacteria bacterium]|nr:LPS-assembly protein LptD [Gammaproteobacteria bacterium]